MNVRTVAACFVLVLLLGGALPSHAADPASPASDVVAAGGGYRLMDSPASASQVVLVRATGSAGGGRYRLEPMPALVATEADAPAVGSTAGCCCIYYPRIRR